MLVDRLGIRLVILGEHVLSYEAQQIVQPTTNFKEDKTMDKNEFKALRLNSGWTGKECADKIGVTFGTVYKYESGLLPVNGRVEKLMRILAVPVVEVTRS